MLIDRYFPALRTSYVALDNYGAIYQAVEHLLGAGYQRIGLINFKSNLFHLQERSRGYRSALAHHQRPTRTSWLKEVSLASPQAEVAKAMQALTSGAQAVEAIVFGSNVLTLAGLKLLNQRPIRVPDELALVGFDQTDAYELLATSLTYINQPLEAMGQLATSILVESLGYGPAHHAGEFGGKPGGSGLDPSQKRQAGSVVIPGDLLWRLDNCAWGIV